MSAKREAWWLAPGATREQARKELREFGIALLVILPAIALFVAAFCGIGWAIHWAWVEMVRSACHGGKCR